MCGAQQLSAEGGHGRSNSKGKNGEPEVSTSKTLHMEEQLQLDRALERHSAPREAAAGQAKFARMCRVLNLCAASHRPGVTSLVRCRLIPGWLRLSRVQ